jgi:hypothetical protein
MLLGCANPTKAQVTQTAVDAVASSTDTLLSGVTVKKNRGQFIFSISAGANLEPSSGGLALSLGNMDVSARSLEQPEAKMVRLSQDKFLLQNLVPQEHTIVVSRQMDGQTAYVVYRDLKLDPDAYVDVGVVPFQKEGALRGRVLSGADSSPAANITVQLKELGFSTTTDANGTFEIQSLPAGQWVLTAFNSSTVVLRPTLINAVSAATNDIGDLWTESENFVSETPTLLNGVNGITSNSTAKFKLKLPPGSRFVTVKSQEGDILLANAAARELLDLPLDSPLKTNLQFHIFNDKLKLLGVLVLPFQYDPFANNGSTFKPLIKISQRVIVSPARRINFEIPDIPQNATAIRFGVDKLWSDWSAPSALAQYDLPKSNLSCGQHMLNIQFKTSAGHTSALSSIPVTLSCWERIPHRAAIDKIIGIQNASVWTGTHAFVWSGKQFNFTNRAAVWGGSNTAETVQSQEELHTYDYLDGGYIFQPQIDPATGNLTRSRMEFIVTDNAPKPRTDAGIDGRNNFVAVYGGENADGPLADGGIYDISKNGWFSMMGAGSPSPRIKPSVHFISDKEVLVWGGRTRTNLGYELPLNDGAIYNIETHVWRSVSTTNLPGARLNHVGVWTGSEFFVMGGILPGSIEVKSAAKYNPSTDTWTKLPDFVQPLTYMSAIYRNNHIILFGRNYSFVVFRITDNTVTNSGTLTNSKWSVNPTLVMDGDGTGSTGSLLHIFGGRASFIQTDVNDQLTVLVYKTGTFDFADGRSKYYANKFNSATSGSVPISRCCSNMLGFAANNRIFAINGTETSNTTVYTKISTSGQPSGGSNNYTSTFYQFQTYNSRILTFDSVNNNVISELFDLPENKVTNGANPLGPYYRFRGNPPVWSPQLRSLLWYGGIYLNPFNYYYQPGGMQYNVDSKTWQKLPVAPSEPTYNDTTFGTQWYSRMLHMNFFLGGAFYVLGGYFQYSPIEYRYDGIKTIFSSGAPTSTTSVMMAPAQAFDFSPIGDTYSATRWDANPPCVAGNSVLLTGGRRKAVRNIAGIDDTKALVQQKVVFDSTTDEMRIAAADPLGVRGGTTVVSTGTECLVWGGYTADGATFSENTTDSIQQISSRYAAKNTGAMYSMAGNTWQEVSTLDAPSARSFMHGVWTGQEALLWGGSKDYSPSVSKNMKDEKGVWLYSPSKNKWTALPSAEGEPPYNADEHPVWTGSHMLLFKSTDSEYSHQFTPTTNSWTRLIMPFGLGYRTNSYWDNHVVWTGEKLYVMPMTSDGMGLMALYVPPDP